MSVDQQDRVVRVLLIDDDEEEFILTQSLLSKVEGWECEVEWEPNYERALDSVVRYEHDVYLVDFLLGDNDGIDLLVSVRAQGSNAPVILLTGWGDRRLDIAAMEAGATDYLDKTKLDAYGLEHSIRYAVERAEMVRALERRTQELETSEVRIRKIFERNADGLIVFDTSHNVIDMNPAAEKMLGESAATSIGRPVRFEVTVDAIAEIQIDDETGQRTAEVRVVDIDWHGELAYLASLRDITAHKETQATLLESNRRLEDTLAELSKTHEQIIKQERLRALGEMASGIAHDLNNTITPVVGFADLLLMYPESADNKADLKMYLEAIRTAAKDAGSVINRLREFYRKRDDWDPMFPVDMNKVVIESKSLTSPKWKDMAQGSGTDIEFMTDLDPDLPTIQGDESSFRTALTNLIINAVDAMPEGGKITVKTRHIGEEVYFEIADTGSGMPDDVRTRAFEPFFTTKGESGTGMGLAMVYGIVERHGGSVDIQSVVGFGTVIAIALPLTTPQGDASRVGPSPVAVQPLDYQIDVLAVDDEPLIRDFIYRSLTHDGHTVTTATNGREALEVLQQARFDLVITDRGMPEIGGDQLASAIKRDYGDVPIIILTGFGELMKASGDLPYGVDLILSKPVTIGILREAIDTVLASNPVPV